MKEFNCGEVVPGCEAVLTGDSDEEILEKVAVHARDEHGMDEVPTEVEDNVRARIVER
jgi:predicted small metal-binding protein